MGYLTAIVISAIGGFIAGWLVGRKWNTKVEKTLRDELEKVKKVKDILNG